MGDRFHLALRLLLVAAITQKNGCLALLSKRLGNSNPRHQTMLFNLWDDVMGFNAEGKLTPVTSLPYGEALLPVTDENRVLAIQERGISFTGEDFDVCDAANGAPVCRVRGALLHLPGKDKMRLFDSNSDDNEVRVTLDRKLLAVTPTYDILRGDGEKIGWIEKTVVAFRDTFEVHLESAPHFGPLHTAPPAYKLEGDFLDRSFTMKTGEDGKVVAVVRQDGFLPQFDAFNHYQVSVAPGMDVGLVVACACAIDEELEEEHQKKREESKEDGGWFG